MVNDEHRKLSDTIGALEEANPTFSVDPVKKANLLLVFMAMKSGPFKLKDRKRVTWRRLGLGVDRECLMSISDSGRYGGGLRFSDKNK